MYCKENCHESLSRSALFEILEVREASQLKSLQGLDNTATDGAAGSWDTQLKLLENEEWRKNGVLMFVESSGMQNVISRLSSASLPATWLYLRWPLSTSCASWSCRSRLPTTLFTWPRIQLRWLPRDEECTSGSQTGDRRVMLDTLQFRKREDLLYDFRWLWPCKVRHLAVESAHYSFNKPS